MSATKKRCARCKRWFLIARFHDGQSRCRRCNTAGVKEWRKRNPELAREQYRRGKARRDLQRESVRAAVLVAGESLPTRANGWRCRLCRAADDELGRNPERYGHLVMRRGWWLCPVPKCRIAFKEGSQPWPVSGEAKEGAQ